MSRILAIHGVATHIDPRRFSFRNLTGADALGTFLSSTPRLVSLPEALAGRGDALTIDDATRAGGDAALLARKHGHAVTLFVNPGQVESGAPYAFLALNALLDGLDDQRREFEGRMFATSTGAHRQLLRRAIKTKVREIADEQARLDLVNRLAAGWGITHLEVPPHFSTLRKRDLMALRDAGVDLQNHGWSHTDHSILSVEASRREVSEGRGWLQRELALDATYFAVPFGDVLPLPNASTGCEIWFTVTNAIPPGRHAPNVFNRETPDLPEGDGRPRLVSAGLRAVSSWTSRLLAFVGRS